MLFVVFDLGLIWICISGYIDNRLYSIMGGYLVLKNKEILLFVYWLNLKDKGEWN